MILSSLTRTPARFNIVALVLVAGVLPGLVSLAVPFVWGDTPRVHLALHASLELVGSCIGLAVAMLLLLRARHEETPPHLLWVAAALVAMGLMDAVHSLTPLGAAFSWTRHAAALAGGILFGLVWLPPPSVAVRRQGVFILIVAGLATALALGIWSRAEALPAPWSPDGYSFTPKAVNALGGFGFLSAALFFLQRHSRQPQTEDLSLASFTMLLGTAGLLFGFMHVWAADWWVRHTFRLLAYAIVLVVAFGMVVALYRRIGRHAQELEAHVRGRTAELEAANARAREEIRDRQQSEEALAESTARYRSLFEHMLNGYAYCRVIYDQGKPQDFVYLEVNPAFEQLTGLSNVVGRKVSDVIPGIRETNPELLDIYGRVALTGRPELFESYVQPLGIWFSVTVYSPASEHFVSVFDNITERKRGEESLRASERAARERAEELQTVMDMAPMAIWVAHDPQCHRITGNRTANAFYEADRDENVSAGPAAGEHDTTRRFFRNGRELEPQELPMQEAAANGRDVRNSELEVLRPSGRRLTMLGSASPLRDDDGGIRGCVGAFVDITERKQAEQSLRDSEERFRIIFERSTIGKSLTAPDGRLLKVNQAFADLLGYTIQELQRLEFASITHPDDLAESKECVRTLLANERSRYRMEKRFLKKDGGEVWTDVSTTLLHDEAGKPVYLITSITDISERKRTEEEVRRLNADLEQRVAARTAELQAANGELEAFTYSVAHDLRAPLRHIDGFSRILLDEHASALNEDAAGYVARIRNGSIQMGRLIDDLLGLARVGRKEIQWQMAGLGVIAAEVIADLKQENPSRAIEWRVAELPFVECDPGLIKVVFENLLSNAVKFTRTRDLAVIEVGTTAEDGRPAVFVRDNGVGFSMRYADKLFGVFQRLHRQEDFEGTGVGLATVQRIVHKHGGRVWAEAELDKGATFHLALGTP